MSNGIFCLTAWTGNKFHVLSVVDTYTRECLAADIEHDYVHKMWSQHWLADVESEGLKSEFIVIMAANLRVSWQTSGLIPARWR